MAIVDFEVNTEHAHPTIPALLRCTSDKNVRYSAMRGNEFIRRVQVLARARGCVCRLDEKRGKGSHVTLYLGSGLTIVRNLKDELKTGTLHAMCKQLGIRREDL